MFSSKPRPTTKEDVVALLREAGAPDKLDLSGHDMKGIDLSGLDLSGADLHGSNLEKSVLSNAVLTNVNEPPWV